LVKIPRDSIGHLPLLAVEVDLEICRGRDEFQQLVLGCAGDVRPARAA
jgi:hypothetical protein